MCTFASIFSGSSGYSEENHGRKGRCFLLFKYGCALICCILCVFATTLFFPYPYCWWHIGCCVSKRLCLLRCIVISPAPASQLLFKPLQSVLQQSTVLVFSPLCFSHPASHHLSCWVFTVFPMQLHFATGKHKRRFLLNNESHHMAFSVAAEHDRAFFIYSCSLIKCFFFGMLLIYTIIVCLLNNESCFAV